MEPQVLLAGIVVDETDRRVAETGRSLHLADDELRGVPGSGDDDLAAARDERGSTGTFDQRTGNQPCTGDERQQEEPVEHRDGPGELKTAHRVREQNDEIRHDARSSDTLRRSPHVARGHVAPPTVVEPERDEDSELQDDRDPDRVAEQPLVGLGNAVVEPQPEREPPRQCDQCRIGEHVPDPVTIDRNHRAGTADASRTVSTTRSWVFASIPAHNGTEKFSCATRSVSGSEPGS